MNNDLLIENIKFNSAENQEMTTINKLKMIGNDSLFYFGIFLASLLFLHFLPYVSGILNDFTIGINEVLVSLIGFANIFFLQVFNKIFSKEN